MIQSKTNLVKHASSFQPRRLAARVAAQVAARWPHESCCQQKQRVGDRQPGQGIPSRGRWDRSWQQGAGSRACGDTAMRGSAMFSWYHHCGIPVLAAVQARTDAASRSGQPERPDQPQRKLSLLSRCSPCCQAAERKQRHHPPHGSGLPQDRTDGDGRARICHLSPFRANPDR